MQHPIYTEISNCRDCYKCLRSCPVKAIQIKDARALIVPERCTWCGTCVDACPNNVKQLRNDIDNANLLLKTRSKVIASIAPSFVSEFDGYADNLIRALYRLGFTAVSETAIGATIVSRALDIYAEEHGSAPFISTACPSVVELVNKYIPEQVENLAPVPSPLQTHCAYLRELYGNDIGIVFIGPCIAKKMEADLHPGYPNVALTFLELRQWLEEENIQLDTIDTGIAVDLVPAPAGKAAVYPIENGQIETSELWMNRFLESDAISASGIDQLRPSLCNAIDGTFLEALNCSGGCINGPGTTRTGSLLARKKAITDYVLARLGEDDLFEGDEAFSRKVLDEGYGILMGSKATIKPVEANDYTEEEIEKALLKLGKHGREDELNCGGCGYQTCRDTAKALLAGLAEPEMCVTKMRKEAESKVDILLSTIPSGVVIVDNELNIADCNKRFVDIFEDYPESFLDAEGLKSFRGTPISAFVPWAEKFSDQFYMSKPAQYRFKHRGKVMRVTFFLVENKRLLGALFDDITTPTVRREAVVNKAEDVIIKSLSTVQQIASLLGENAAETEIVLNSIIEEFNVQSDTSSDYGLIEEN